MQARAFNCRSFAQKGDRCYLRYRQGHCRLLTEYYIKLSNIFPLSGDDSITLPDSPQPDEQGATYKEKVCTRSKFCNDPKLLGESKVSATKSSEHFKSKHVQFKV